MVAGLKTTDLAHYSRKYPIAIGVLAMEHGEGIFLGNACQNIGGIKQNRGEMGPAQAQLIISAHDIITHLLCHHRDDMQDIATHDSGYESH
jgi:hypothetical protein